jgi:hypothetical protein
MVQLDEAYNGDNWVTHLYIEGIRFHLLQTHERKNGCVNAIIQFIGFCRNQLKMDIRAFMSDRERSLGSVIREYCDQEGIIFQQTVAGTPEQNGFIERAGGILITVARKLISDANLPKNLWPEAFRASVYIINRTPTMMPDGTTIIPWVEAMTASAPGEDLRPNLSNLRLYGCKAYVRIQNIPRLDKMAPRAEIGYLVGYVASNIWKIWFPHLGTVREVRDVVFDETRQYMPEEVDLTIPQDIRLALPWTVPEYSEEDEYSGAPPSSNARTQSEENRSSPQQNNSVTEQNSSRIVAEELRSTRETVPEDFR